MPNDSFDDVWEMLQFSLVEGLLLRSFVEYLRVGPEPWEKKIERVNGWKHEIGLQLGNPQMNEQASKIIQTIRDTPPELRKKALQLSLEQAHSKYFD
jgi:hypothetical protein